VSASPATTVPSPKSNAYSVLAVPVACVDPLASAVTVSGTAPESGLPSSAAAVEPGCGSAVTVDWVLITTSADVAPLLAPSSVTTTRA